MMSASSITTCVVSMLPLASAARRPARDRHYGSWRLQALLDTLADDCPDRLAEIASWYFARA